MVDNNRAKIWWDFKIQTYKKVLVNQPDIMVVDKEWKRAIVIDVAIAGNRRIGSMRR